MNARPKNGFSLIEILVVIVTIGVLAAGAYLVAVNMRTASYEAKLDSDVAMLNRAVRLYETSGGVIAGGYTEEQVLAQLRKVAANTKKVSGLRGSVVDPRLTITRQTAAEAATSSRRAVWNDASKQFEIRTSGGNPGIKAFVLGDVAAVSAAVTNPDGSITPAGKDDRRTTFDLAERDNWVWDYTASTSGSSTGPVTQVVTQGGTSATPSSSDKQLITLDPPDFSLTSGAYALSEFPMTVTLSLPAGVTEENAYVLYVDPASAGSWLRYTGAIQVDPGQVVTAKTVTLDPDNYVDSADQANRYTSVPEVLSLSLTFAKNAYNYGELGGSLASGAVAAAAPGGLTVTGPTGIGAQYFNGTNFQLYWTMDGSDPAVSSTRSEAPAFGGAPPAVALPLGLAGFLATGTSQVRAVAVSKNADLFQNSPEAVKSLGIEKTTLTSVGVVYDGTTVSMAPVSLSGQPAGTRIFYTSSGNDPGHNGTGDPAAGDAVAYSAPVTPTALLTQYSARLYPPVEYKTWFIPGPAGTTGVSQPSAGNFYASTSAESNLYQFDPSTGRSIVLSNGCLFAPAGVAYLSTPAARVYYVEQADNNWRLASYGVSTSVHTHLGSLTSASWSYAAPSRPSNLTAYNGSLFYIPNQTDDLIRIDFNPDGTIMDQYKFADITGDAASFQTIGDIAVTPGGLLYVSASNAWAVFDVRSLSPITVAAGTPAWVWSGLLTNPSGTLLGVRSTEPDKLYTVNPATGAGSSPLVFNPARSFDDFGSPVSDIPFNLPATHFAISPGRQTLYRVDLETGRNYPVRTGLGFTPGAIAYQPGTGKILLGTDTDFQLYQYNPSDGSLINFSGMYATGIAYPASTPPRAMAWFNGSLFYPVPGTDDLVRITLSGNTIATRVKVADLNGNASTGTLDGMAIGPDGGCYFANSDTDRLSNYDLANLGGYSPVTQAAPANFLALTFNAAGEMHGVLNNTAADRTRLVMINPGTGLTTAKATFQPALEFSDISGLNDSAPAPVSSNYYTVDGLTPRLYLLDPATGENSILTASAPWPIGAVALDGEQQFLYYTRAGSYELGLYNITANTHSGLTALNAGTLTYVPAAAPANLTWFNGALYYVTPGTDDLVRVDLTATGTVGDAWKEADLNGNAAIGTVGDLAVDSAGLLYLSTDTCFARFDLKSLTGFVTLSTDVSLACASLFTLGGTSLNGTTTAAPKTLRTISAASGALGSSVATSPSRTIADAASAQARVSVVNSGGTYYAAVTGKSSLYTMNVTTGEMKPATASCPVPPESVAYDPVRKIVYYTEVGGNASTIRLYQYNPSTQAHSLTGNIAGAAGYTLTATPKNLLFLYGDLYCVPALDDLVRIRFTSGTPELGKVMDLSGNNVDMGTVGALAVNPSGTLYFSREDGDLLGNVSLYSPRNWTLATGTTRLTSLVVFPSTTPRGTNITTPTVVENIHPLTGVRSAGTATAPSLSIRDIGGITVPAPYLPECYAVGGGNTSIYKFNPGTGATSTVTSSAPFILNSIARSPSRGRLYYLENTASNWRLGSYHIAQDTHSILATLGSGAWTNIPATRPNNLFLWDDNLFFIAPSSDDIYQITLNAAGTTVTAMAKVDDMSFSYTNPPLNFSDTGDVAVGTDANAQISGGSGFNGYFRMFSHKELISFPPQSQNWRGLLINASGQFYGSKDTEETRVYEIQRGSGNQISSVDTFPAVTFWDMAGEEPSRPASVSNSLWAISKTTGRLGEFLNWNLLNVTSRDWGELKYLSGGTATSFPGPSGGYQLESLAVSDTNTAYFVRNYPTTVDGVTYQRPLFTLNLNNLTWGSTPTPPVATFVGDLAPVLSQLGTLSNTAGQDLVTGLCVGPDWKLQILFNKGDDTAPDFLLRVNSLHVNTARALTNISIIGQITGTGETCTGGKDLVYVTAPVNSLYVVDDADDKIYAVTYQTAAVTSVLSTEPGSSYEGLTSYQANSELIAVNGSGGSPANAVRTVVSGTSNDTTRFDSNAISGGALANPGAIAFPIAQLSLNTDPMPACFAVDRSARIYRVDPASGVTVIETTGGLFNIDAVAYDLNTSTVFYLENSDSTIRIAKYKDGVHTLIGDLKTTGVYKPATHPQHLLHYGDSLYYVNNGTSDVVRVRLNSSTNGIFSQTNFVTMSAGAAWTVTAAALDNNGVLYFNEGTNQRSYDLRTQSNLTAAVVTGNTRNALLHVASSGLFYSGDAASPARVSSVTISSGAAGTYQDTSPPVTLYDMAGGTTSPFPVAPTDTTFYATDGSSTIYMVEPTTGANTALTTTTLFTSIEAVATDKIGAKIYYIQQGSPYKLGVYDRSANTHTLLASLQTQGGLNWAMTSQPSSLTWFNGHLYFYINNAATLRVAKIELKPDGSFHDTMEEVNTTYDTAFGTIGDLAIDSTGWMYLSSSARFCRYNIASSSGFQVLSSTPTSYWTGLMMGADGTTLYGTRDSEPTKLHTVNIATGEPAGTAFTTSPARSMTDLGSPQQPVMVQPNGLRYMITSGCWTIHRMNLETGADYQITSLLNGQPTAIAHAYADGALYLINFTDWDGAIFLEKYELATGFTTVLGSLKSNTLTYPCTGSTLATAPHAMVYAGGKLYYVAYGTDDLIEITLNAAKTSIVNAARVVDLNGGTTLGDVEAMTLSSDGMLYISRVDAHNLYRYDFANRGALTVLSNVSNAKYNVLTFSDAGVLHGIYTSSDKQIRTFTGSSPWTSTYKITGWTSNNDTTGLNADAIIYNNPLSPVYAVGDFSRTATADFRGVAKFTADGALDTSFNVGAGANAGAAVRGLARAADGKVLVGGDFSSMGGTARNALARLNTDGTLDTSFLPAITVQDPYTLDWSTVSMVQGASLSGVDTTSSSATSANHGLATGGGFSGFGTQTLSNVNGSGINVTLAYSQNMTNAAGSSTGPSLYSPSGGGGSAGINPDARVSGPYALAFNADRTGTITPATFGFNFSSPVYIDSVILGGLCTIAGQPENTLIRAWSAVNAGGTLVAASNYENFSAEAGPFYGSATDPILLNATTNVLMGSGSGSLYHTQGNAAEPRQGRVRLGWATSPVQSAAVSLWAPLISVPSALNAPDFFSWACLVTGGNFNITAIDSAVMGPKTGVTSGVKLGFTNGAVQGQFHVHSPLVGSVGTADNLRGSGGTLLAPIYQDLSALRAQAVSISNSVGSLTPTQTFSASIINPATINATASNGWNVILINEVALGGSEILTLNGTASDYIIINVQKRLNFTASSGIRLTGGLLASRVLVNCLPGSTGLGFTGSATATGGSFFAVQSTNSVTLTGSAIINGGVYANNLDLAGGSIINSVPFSGVPAAATAQLSKLVFRPATSTPGKVWVIAPQTDGKILIGGEFSHVNGTACRNIARLNADGTTDTTFLPNSGGAGPSGAVLAIKPLGNGKVLVGGDFGTWNGSSAGAKLVLLTATGARDTGYTSTLSTAASDTVRMIEGDPAGTSFWIGGSFTAPKNNLARITAATGAADATFSAGGTGPNGRVNSATLSGTSLIIGGDFTSYNGTSRNFMARISTTGALDSTFTRTMDLGVDALFTASGATWFHAGGRFTTHDGQPRNKITGANPTTAAAMQGPWGPTGMTINSIANIE